LINKGLLRPISQVNDEKEKINREVFHLFRKNMKKYLEMSDFLSINTIFSHQSNSLVQGHQGHSGELSLQSLYKLGIAFLR
jgi:hypothetical protein